MAVREKSDTYRGVRIVLHWSVVALVLVQYATGGSIERMHHAEAHGHEPAPLDPILHTIHNRSGLVIFALMLGWLVLRWHRGALAPLGGRSVLGEAASTWQGRLSSAMHAALYAVLLSQAATGAVASYLFWPISHVHAGLADVTLVLVALHALAAFWHHFLERDETLRRMLGIRPRVVDAASVAIDHGHLGKSEDGPAVYGREATG